jgi:isopenicillin-N epimerase
MARALRRRLAALTGLVPIAPDNGEWFAQMIAAPLPPCDLASLSANLYERYRVEVPLIARPESAYVRVSFQGYNTQADADTLVQALSELLPQ